MLDRSPGVIEPASGSGSARSTSASWQARSSSWLDGMPPRHFAKTSYTALVTGSTGPYGSLAWLVVSGGAAAAVTSADQVWPPATPSGVSPALLWNCLTAVSVPDPKCPSTVSAGDAPAALSASCNPST